MFRSLNNFLLAFLLLGLLAGCATAPVTGRQQFIIIDPQTELRLGLQASREILRKEKLCRDPRINEIVQKVGWRIAKATQKNLPWEFFVIDKPKVINAFCLPGGKVFVYTGIIPIAKNEAGLAAVMGHEIAHAIARHGAERLSLGLVATFGEVLLAEILDLKNPHTKKIFLTAYGLGATVGVILPYSRKQELEADHIGLYLMAKAGYDPREAINFWERMREAARGKPKPPPFLSTHPTDEARIAQLKRLLPEILPIYEAAPQKFGRGQDLPPPRCP
ncbi:MAG: M48 family metallopeptidase [Thermodesulfobacteria bacterium]|nr:M48 family metallopeptidase [Thermodesulfobacteriota bacterium]